MSQSPDVDGGPGERGDDLGWPSPLERSAGIGARLRQQREAMGLTFADAERDTRINARYLEAIEAEDFNVLPAPVYARGFMRSYSAYLGIDPVEAVAAIPERLEPLPGMQPMPGLRRAPRRELPWFEPRTILRVVAAVVLLGLLYWASTLIGGDGIGVDIPVQSPTPDSPSTPTPTSLLPAIPLFVADNGTLARLRMRRAQTGAGRVQRPPRPCSLHAHGGCRAASANVAAPPEAV